MIVIKMIFDQKEYVFFIREYDTFICVCEIVGFRDCFGLSHIY